MTREFVLTTTSLLCWLMVCHASATTPATFVANNVECMLYAVKGIDAQFQQQHSWMCGDLDTLNSNNDNEHENRFRSISFADIDSHAHTDLQEYISSSGAKSGKSKLIFSEVLVTPSMATIILPKDATLQIEDVASHERRLAPTEGQLKTLVVRVFDKNGKKPAISGNDFYDTVLKTSGDSMANQYRDCSFNKLDIVPYGGSKNTALLDIQIDTAIEVGVSERTVIANEAKNKLLELYDDDDYDLVQFCFPGGTMSSKGDTGQGWAAFAPISNKYSYANDKGDYCRNISTWVHEVGHSIGLYHSGGADQTDPMGASYNEGQVGYQKQCFNAEKNYQLGWYSKMQKKVDPLNFPGPSFSKTFKMIGVNDYDVNAGEGNKKKVILKLKDYYIGYNAKKGITNGDRKDSNTIFIVREAGDESRKQAALTKGQSFTITNYEQGRDVTIKYISITDNDVVTIEIFDDANAPVQTLAPVGSGCYSITVEVVGDNYPEDINWVIEDVDTNLAVVDGDNYENKKDFDNPDIRTYCLPYGTEYLFIMKDDNSDGICCRSYGDGYYRVLDEDGETLFWGGKLNGKENSYDYSQSTPFSTPARPDFLSDPIIVDESCINSTKKFKIDGKKFTCDTIKKKKHCELYPDDGNKKVKKMCPSVCQKKKCGGRRRQLALEENRDASEEIPASSLRRGQPQR